MINTSKTEREYREIFKESVRNKISFWAEDAVGKLYVVARAKFEAETAGKNPDAIAFLSIYRYMRKEGMTAASAANLALRFYGRGVSVTDLEELSKQEDQIWYDAYTEAVKNLPSQQDMLNDL
jgi:hypothetical protein